MMLMRMWMVNPRFMCRQHLLDEHNELHMFVGTIQKADDDLERKLKEYIENGLVEVHNIRSRHEELVIEMERRGYNHNSPLPYFYDPTLGEIDRDEAFQELTDRCPDCWERYMKYVQC